MASTVRSISHTVLAKMGFDEILDLTAGACFYFYNSSEGSPRSLDVAGWQCVGGKLECQEYTKSMLALVADRRHYVAIRSPLPLRLLLLLLLLLVVYR